MEREMKTILPCSILVSISYQFKTEEKKKTL